MLFVYLSRVLENMAQMLQIALFYILVKRGIYKAAVYDFIIDKI